MLRKTGFWILAAITIFQLLILHDLYSRSKKFKSMVISSSAFKQGESIPAEYTCDGKNVSPPLKWSGFPAGTKSFALICDDPDAPRGTWVHWVYYNIPAKCTELQKGISPVSKPSGGGEQGVNDFRKIGYGGPCPPGGTHR